MNSTYEAPRRLIKSAEDIEKMRVAGRLAAFFIELFDVSDCVKNKR